MIDENKLIEHFENMRDDCNLFRWRSARKIKDGLKAIILRQPKVGEWTPCTEKLPTDGIVYELSCRYLQTDYVTIGYCKHGKPIYSYLADDNNVFIHSEVIAWRPMPDSYREE